MTINKKIAVAVVLGLVAGLLVAWVSGLVEDKADAAEARAPLCNSEFVCGVSSARDGVNKARAGKLGRNYRRVRYNPDDAQVILRALMKRQRQALARGTMNRSARLTRAQMWRTFRADDNCVYKKSGTGSGTWPPQARWSCNWPHAHIPDINLNSGDVRAMFCNGSAAAGVGVALLASAGGPPAWIGIGTAWTTCMFQMIAERAADRQ